MGKGVSLGTRKRLTQKQEEFAREYIIDFDAKKAALRSGYSYNYATVKAHKELVENPLIQCIIKKEIRKRNARIKWNQDAVMDKLSKLVDVNVQQFYDKDNLPKKLKDLDSRTTYAIKKVKSKVLQSGEDMTIIEHEFELHDKLSAIKEMAKLMGMYGLHNEQKQKDSQLIVYLPDNQRNDKTKADLQLPRSSVTDIEPDE